MTGIKANVRSWANEGRQSALLLILFVYTFIPFETAAEGLALQIRSAAAMLLIFYAFFKAKWHFDHKTLAAIFLSLAMVVIAAVVSISGRAFVLVISVLLGAVLSCATRDDIKFRASFMWALEALLAMSSFALLLQVFIWQATGEIVQIHEIVFPLSDARFEDRGFVARMGGVFIEPGTFANWMCLFVVCYLLLIDQPKQWLMFLVGSAMVASVSAWGIASGLTILLVSAARTLRRRPWYGLVVVACAGWLLPFLLNSEVLEFLEAKSALESESGDSKVIAINEFTRIFSEIFLLGQGFAPDFCRGCLSPQDAGVFIGFSVVFGISCTAIVFILFYLGVLQKRGVYGFFIAVFVMLSKVFYWDFILWVLFFLAWRSKSVRFD